MLSLLGRLEATVTRINYKTSKAFENDLRYFLVQVMTAGDFTVTIRNIMLNIKASVLRR